MAVDLHEASPPRATAPEPDRMRWDHAVVGLLILAVGLGWFLDMVGVSVPWRLFPAAGLVVVGIALVLARRHRGGLISLGVVLAVTALLSAAAATRFVGPVGERVIGPAIAEWPVDSSMSVGKLTVDLTEAVLPLDQRMQVGVGIGDIQIIVPAGARVQVDVGVGMGDIRVDGRSVDSGMAPRWTEDSAADGAVVLDAHVGLGSIEVNHE